MDEENERLTPINVLKEVRIGPLEFQVTKLGISLFKVEKDKLVALLRTNVDLFAWEPFNMPWIDTREVYHCLSIKSLVKSMS